MRGGYKEKYAKMNKKNYKGGDIEQQYNCISKKSTKASMRGWK